VKSFGYSYDYICIIFVFCCNEQVLFLTSHLKTIMINSYIVWDFLISFDDEHKNMNNLPTQYI